MSTPAGRPGAPRSCRARATRRCPGRACAPSGRARASTSTTSSAATSPSCRRTASSSARRTSTTPPRSELYARYLQGWAAGLEFGQLNPRAATQIVMEQFPGLSSQMNPTVATESMMQLANVFAGRWDERKQVGLPHHRELAALLRHRPRDRPDHRRLQDRGRGQERPRRRRQQLRRRQGQGRRRRLRAVRRLQGGRRRRRSRRRSSRTITGAAVGAAARFRLCRGGQRSVLVFDHVGLTTHEPQPDENWIEQSRCWVTNPRNHPESIEFLRYEPDIDRARPSSRTTRTSPFGSTTSRRTSRARRSSSRPSSSPSSSRRCSSGSTTRSSNTCAT